MAAPVEAVTGIHHGDGCTCRPLDPITLTARPVLVDPACPRQHDTPRTDEVTGRVVITWPAAIGSGPLVTTGVVVEDATTGEQILDAVALRMDLGSDQGWTVDAIMVAITRLVDGDGEPIGAGPGSANRIALTDEYAEWQTKRLGAAPDAAFAGQRFRTAVFRYAVAEMRVAEA